MPSSRHSVDALGHPSEERVGRLVEHAAVERRSSAPCRRARPGSTSVTSAPGLAASRAATSPVMPPPTTTIDGHGAAARTRSARAPSTAGSSLRTRVRAKARPTSAATRGGLDVEVVDHLEVVADEALRAHEHARRRGRSPASSRITSRMSGPRHGSGVRPADCQAQRPARPRRARRPRRPRRRTRAAGRGTGRRPGPARGGSGR